MNPQKWLSIEFEASASATDVEDVHDGVVDFLQDFGISVELIRPRTGRSDIKYRTDGSIDDWLPDYVEGMDGVKKAEVWGP